MDNLEEMDKFLERYSLPRLNQKEIENIWTNQALKLKLWLKTSQQTEVQDLMATRVNFIKHLGKSYQTFIPLKLFQKVAEKGKLPNSFHEAPSPLYQNQTKIPQKKKITG